MFNNVIPRIFLIQSPRNNCAITQKVKNILRRKHKAVGEFVARPGGCVFLSSVIKANELSRINVPHVIELKFYGSFRGLYPRERARVKGLLT